MATLASFISYINELQALPMSELAGKRASCQFSHLQNPSNGASQLSELDNPVTIKRVQLSHINQWLVEWTNRMFVQGRRFAGIATSGRFVSQDFVLDGIRKLV
jgi:hypothetical protein